jgi:hypothetical protein
MKKMKNILKGAGVLLLAAIMTLSAVAVTANTTNDQEITPACLETGAERVDNSGVWTINPDVVWDNGYPNEVNGLCCQRVGSVPVSDVADDFHTTQTWTITGAEWDTIDDTTYAWDGTDDMIIYEFTPTGPGAIVQEIWNVPNTRVQMGELFGRPWWRYTIDLVAEGLEFDLPAGDYYILLRPYTPGTIGQSFWATSDAPPESQSEVYFRSDYFGYPDWVIGNIVFGTSYDVSFRIFGVPSGPPPEYIFDNEDPNWIYIMQWALRPHPNAINEDYRMCMATSTPVKKAICQVDGVVTDGNYDVYVNTFGHPAGASNQIWIVKDMDSVGPATLVDMSGSGWVYLGNYDFDTSSMQGVATLALNANGIVIVDAVQLVGTP